MKLLPAILLLLFPVLVNGFSGEKQHLLAETEDESLDRVFIIIDGQGEEPGLFKRKKRIKATELTAIRFHQHSRLSAYPDAALALKGVSGMDSFLNFHSNCQRGPPTL